MKRPRYNQEGFTLSELIVSMVIAALVFILIVGIFTLNQSVARKTSTQGELLQNGRIVLDTIARELRQAQEIVTVLPEDTSDPELVPMEIEFEDGHVTSQIQYIRYYLNGMDLYRQVKVYYFESDPTTYVRWNDTDPFGSPEATTLEDRQLAEYFTSLHFYGADVITTEVELENKNETIELITTIDPRNI